MNHIFKDNFSGKCAICARPEQDHSDNAQCESCPAIGPCELIDDILMCANCQARDIEVKRETLLVIDNSKESRVAVLADRLAKEIPTDRRQYFVNRLTAIVDIECELQESGVENPQYRLAELVEANLLNLKRVLTGLHEQIREAQAESVADQKYLNQIVPQLRAEEREKFKAYDINYKPSVVASPQAVSKPRMSATDKAYESMAKTLNMTVEQYKAHLAKVMTNVLSVKCTCSETPGMCKIHPKG